MLLELKHIYKNYLQDKIVIPVLKDVNISIDEGEYVTFWFWKDNADEYYRLPGSSDKGRISFRRGIYC